MTRARRRSRAAYFKAYNRKKGRRASAGEVRGERLVLGIDGEGYSLPDGSHRYVYMAACSRAGLVGDVRNPKGLTADEVFRFLLSLPRKALLVGFALGYDRTKWVESWPDERIWRLMHPDDRQGESGPLPVDCEGWRVNLVATRMTVRRADDPTDARTVWDVWKFFQSSFVKALQRWEVGTKRQVDFIARQKERRGSFAGIGRREERYCQSECTLLAELVTRLLSAHEEAGIHLKSYYGPGSTAAVVLAEMGADQQRARFPERMALAVYSGYFGGRFECSRVGPIAAKRLYAYDIASAYPHAFTRIPCLDPRHGHWVRRKGSSLQRVHPIATCVRFVVKPHARARVDWGPLPHRLPDGNIVFPTKSAGGWAWLPEVRAAKRLHPGVKVKELWTWRPTCHCTPPYAERVRFLYDKRKEWGKSGRGIVLKLLLNSLYGKSAQRAGKGRFRCMVRAGLVTAMTRARLLDAVALARPWEVLELATDSVLSTRPIRFPRRMLSSDLGGWEEKGIDKTGWERDVAQWAGGIHLMRPGVRFPIKARRSKRGREAMVSNTAARGLGPKVLVANHARIRARWKRAPLESVTVPTPSFFHGATLSVRRRVVDTGDPDEAQEVFTRDAEYGCWTSEERTLTYGPLPKRAAVLSGMRLECWELPIHPRAVSVPYGVGKQSAIADELDRMRELDAEQPDREALALV